MRSGLRRLLVLACVLGIAVWLGQSVALATPTPTGPVQPGSAPLTAVSYTSSGDIGEAGGLTYSFSGLTSGLLAQFSDLEWGPADSAAVQLSMDGNASFSEPGQTLTFNSGDSDLASGTAVWTGTTPYPLAQPAETLTLDTRFTMTASTSLIATSGYGDGATVPVTGDFSATLLFEVSADGGSTWTPATDYFNAQHNVVGNTVQSSFLGGFFYVLASAPVASVSPSPFGFGNQPVGQTSAAQVFTVQNTGTAGLQMNSASVSGDFAIPSGSDMCSGTTVAPGGTCTISVTFTPTQTGSLSGTLTISDNAADSPQQVALSGTGAQPALSLSPSSLAFGGQGVGTTSAAQTVTITNTGTADLDVSAVSTSGTNAGDFSASPSGCGDIAPSGTCTISVTFTPSGAGARSATLNIVSDAPSSPDQVSLSGTGLNSHLSLSPNPMNFGNVLLGQSKTLTLTFSNSGSDPAQLTGATFGGPNSGDFTLVQTSLTCPTNPSPYVPAGSSCTVSITFTPGAAGARSATLTIANNSSDGPQQLTLSGNGTSAVAPQITSGASDTVMVGSAFSYTVTSTGTPTPALSLSSGSTLPAGVTFTDNGDGTGTLAGTSSVAPGVYTFTLQADNGVSPNATQAFTLTLAASGAPVITSAPGTTVTAGTAMTPFTITTTGFPLPSLTKTGALPSGVTFTDNHNGTATISGNPKATTGGTYIFTVTAENSQGTVRQTFTLTVNQAPTITSKASTTFAAGDPGTFTVTTSGFPAPALTDSGTLPAGVTFTDNGNGTATISGTPAQAGSYPILITATNTTGGVSQSFTLGVDQPLVITSAPGTTTTAGTAMAPFTITTTGYPVPSLTKTGTLPPGITFTDNDNGTATINGVPKATDGGNYTVTITAKNNQGTVTQAFTLVVDEAPIITSKASTTFTAGDTGTFTVTTDGFPAATLTESDLAGHPAGLPAGVTFTDNGNGTATISGIPTADGSYPIVLTATNAFGSASESFTLKVS